MSDFDLPENILGYLWLVECLQYLKRQILPTSSLPTENGSGNCVGNSLPTLA